MEVIIVLIIIIGVVGYFIYQSSPNTKYEKAKNLFNAKDYPKAINILNEIFKKHPDAPSKLAEIKLHLGNQTSGNNKKKRYFNEVIEIRKRIQNPTSLKKFDSIEAKAFFEISKIKYEEGISTSLELTQANNQLLQSQTGYISAAVQLIQAKSNLDKALNQ